MTHYKEPEIKSKNLHGNAVFYWYIEDVYWSRCPKKHCKGTILTYHHNQSVVHYTIQCNWCGFYIHAT